MHNAPSVSYPVGRSAFVARALVAGWLVGLTVTVLTWPADAPWWRPLIAVISLVVPAILGRRLWQQLPRGGHLRWDGQDWHSPSSPDVPAVLHVQLDGQHHLLVRLQPVAHRPAEPTRWSWPRLGNVGAEWLWLQAASDPARWPDLRRAAFARSARASRPAPDSP